MSYNAGGTLGAFTYGNGLMESRGYDTNRLQLTSIQVTNPSPASTVMSYTYVYTDANGNNNGQLQQAVDNVNSNNSQVYSYDSLARLSQFKRDEPDDVDVRTPGKPGTLCNITMWIKKLQTLPAIFLCLMLSACSHYGQRDLILLPMPEEGSEILSTNSKNDSVKIRNNSITMRADGIWLLTGTTQIYVQIENNTKTPITIDFDECTLMDNHSIKLQFLGAQEETGGRFGMVPSATINNEKKRFALTYSLDWNDKRLPGPRDLASTELALRIPISVDQEPDRKVNFVFKFKYAKRRDSIFELLKRLL